MNNIGSKLPDIDARTILRAADALIGTVRKHGNQHAQLEVESVWGERWRITIERVQSAEAKQ